MIKVHSSNNHVAGLINELVEVVENAGGYICPSLELKLIDNQLSFVSRRKMQRGERMVLLPMTCMPLLSDFEFALNHGKLHVATKNKSVSGPHQQIVELTVSIYNELDKLYGHSKVAAPVIFAQDREFLSMLLPAAGAEQYAPDKFATAEQQQIACFLNTRALYDPETACERMIPIIELFDHNPFAGGFLFDEIEQRLSIGVNFIPVGVKKDVFITYTVMDALETLVKFGFADTAAFFVHSQPFTLELPEIGSCRICRCDVGSYQLDKVGWLWPPKYHTSLIYNAKLQRCDDTYEMAYCLIPYKAHIPAFDDALKHNLARFERMAGLSAGTVNTLETINYFKKQLVQENKRFYKKLVSVAKQSLSEKQNEPVVKMLFAAIKHQMRLILEFEKHI